MHSKFSLVGAVCAAILLIVSLEPAANATPYASGVSVNAGVVTFILNESADNVTVNFDGGASTQDLGPLGAGTHSFNLGLATSFDIMVSKDAPTGYAQGVLNQISSDSNILNRFVNQRGVTVNKNPASPAFGRIYVSVATAGTSAGRTLGEGIYVLNADQSEVGGLGTNALNGGLAFTTGTAGSESPHRLTLGPDDNLYIGDWSDANGSLFVTDANVANGQNVLFGVGGPCPLTTSRVHGSISAAWVEGSLATSDLTVWVIDEDLQSNRDASCATSAGTERNSIWRWDIGAGPLAPNTLPTKLTTALIATDPQLADLTRGPDGKWYASQRRAEPANSSGLFVRNPDGTALWSSLTATRLITPGATDFLGETVAIDVSADGRYLVALRRDNAMTILPLLDGIPDMTNRVLLTTTPTTVAARDVAFDIAGNIYAVSSGNFLLRVFSPGGNTTATTRSDGSFNLAVVEVPRVSVTVADAEGAEEGSDAVSFTLARTGDLGQALTVNYTMSGTTENGTDYNTLPLTVDFPENEATVTVTVTPMEDTVAEFTETVTLNLAFTTEYSLQNPTNATATIVDNEPATLRLTAGSKTNAFEPLPRDTINLTVSRLGNLAADIFTAELVASGTATENDDFVLSTNYFAIPPNVVTLPITVTPVNDFLLEGDETVSITLGPGSFDYEIDAQDSASGLIRDDEQPAAPVLFTEDFSGDASANWQIQFGANNGIYDATVDWRYDYSGLGIGFAPNTEDGSSVGLYAAVNKTNSAARGSAGINFYPIGRSFSGDYALRFDMYLGFGTASTTEHALLGINHSGSKTNRATQSADAGNSTAAGDGFWVSVVTDASDLRDYSGHTYLTPDSLPTVIVNRAASTLTGQITSPPYASAGSPGSSGNNKSWTTVELSQVNDLISLKVNNILIWEHQNTNAYTSGNIMIGANDQFDSVPTANASQHFVVFDNVRVVNLSTDIEITSVELNGANELQIDFTSPTGGQPGDYSVQSTLGLASPSWGPIASTISSLGGNNFRAIVSRGLGEQYYRISKP